MTYKLPCFFDMNADLFFEWAKTFKGSVSIPEDSNGLIKIKYPSIPFFLYIISKKIDDFSFLDEKTITEIVSDEDEARVADMLGYTVAEWNEMIEEELLEAFDNEEPFDYDDDVYF